MNDYTGTSSFRCQDIWNQHQFEAVANSDPMFIPKDRKCECGKYKYGDLKPKKKIYG